MKKRILILLCAMPILTACPDGGSSIKPDTIDPNVPEIIHPTPSPELSPTAQQEKLESVGMALMAECPSEDFENIGSIIETFASVDFEEYNLDPLYEWMQNVSEITFKDNNIENSTENNYSYVSDEELLVLLSNYNGLFTFANNTVTISDYNGTKAVITLDGKKYEAEITHKGKEQKAYFVYEYESKYQNGSYYDHYTEKAVYDIRVPEEINVNITENGRSIAGITARFSASLTESGLTPTVDAFATTTTITVNSYSIVYENSGYDGSASKARFVRTLKKGDKALITTTATADLQLSIEKESWAKSDDNYSESNEYTSLVANTAKNIIVAMDIFGEVQVNGTCTDMLKCTEELDAMNEALYDHGTADIATANKHLDAAEKYMDFGVYYNGSNKQADIEFELQYEETEWGYNYDVVPVIVFNNGSKFSLSQYFTEDTFSDLIDAAYALAEAYGNTFGIWIE